MEIAETAERMNAAHQPVAVCDLYKDALTHLMSGLEEPVGPGVPEKREIIKKYMAKAEALNALLTDDPFDTCIESANRTISKAITYDKEHQYPDAVQFYRRGVDFYHRALRVARSEEERATLARNIKPCVR